MCAAIKGIASLKITEKGSTSTMLPDLSSVNPEGRVHPRIGGNHDNAAKDPRQHDGNAGPEVGPRFQRRHPKM